MNARKQRVHADNFLHFLVFGLYKYLKIHLCLAAWNINGHCSLDF